MQRVFPMTALLALTLFGAATAMAQQAGDLDGPMTENPGYNQTQPKPAKKTVTLPAAGQNADDLPNLPVPKASTAPASGSVSSSSTGGIPANAAAPRSDDESSSESERIDLSPPPGDDKAHPEGTSVAGELLHQREWSPMRCMKDVEVGTFYYKQGNYKAALSRLREALEYKPRDAVATFRLAQTLEKLQENEEARQRYEEYLTILKDGPFAAEAHKSLTRLDAEKATLPPAENTPAADSAKKP